MILIERIHLKRLETKELKLAVTSNSNKSNCPIANASE